MMKKYMKPFLAFLILSKICFGVAFSQGKIPWVEPKYAEPGEEKEVELWLGKTKLEQTAPE